MGTVGKVIKGGTPLTVQKTVYGSSTYIAKNTRSAVKNTRVDTLMRPICLCGCVSWVVCRQVHRTLDL